MNLRDQKKQQSRARILQNAALLFRKNGIVATGVDVIMKSAGLTPGAFYAHFQSKDDLIGQALTAALNESEKRLTNISSPKKDRRRRSAILDSYLATEHRDHPENGCALAALAGELAHQNFKTRKILVRHLESWVANMERMGLRRDQALRAIATAVGSLILSRVVNGTPLSDELLKAGKQTAK